MRNREAIEPCYLYSAEADVLHATAGNNAQTVCKDAQVLPGSESVASIRGTARIPGRPDMFQKRYAALNS